MSDHFLTADEYDERAHSLYTEGDYEGALEMLKEGLALYPNAVELCVGLGYARLAREEYAWARRAFQRALVLEPAHEDALVGMGEVLLRLGFRDEALKLFRLVESMGYHDDPELMLTMGRALYREELFGQARSLFTRLASVRPDSGEAVAALGYTLYRLGQEVEACRHVRRALRLEPDLHDARVFLGHVLYERGDWDSALRELERVPPPEHWDALAVWRVMELMRAVRGIPEHDARLAPWADRLRLLEGMEDPIDRLLAEVEAGAADGGGDRDQLELFQADDGERDEEVHHVRLPDGHGFRGGWHEIVMQMRDHAGFNHESVPDYMRRLAERWHEDYGVEIPFSDPEAFVRSAVEKGLLRMEG